MLFLERELELDEGELALLLASCIAAVVVLTDTLALEEDCCFAAPTPPEDVVNVAIRESWYDLLRWFEEEFPNLSSLEEESKISPSDFLERTEEARVGRTEDGTLSSLGDK